MHTVGSSGQDGILDYVNCSGNELSLWHCRAKHGEQSEPLLCSSVAYVVCAGRRLLLLAPRSGVRNQTRNFFIAGLMLVGALKQLHSGVVLNAELRVILWLLNESASSVTPLSDLDLASATQTALT